MTTHSSRAALQARALARPGLLTLGVSLVTAATLGVVVYLASTSLPFMAASPTTDPVFGELNQCLLEAVPGPRVGFAVSSDGARAVAYGGAGLALCARDAAVDAGTRASPRRFDVPGVTGAAFDFDDNLWVSTERERKGDPQLWRLGGARPERVGDFAPIALAGHARGVVALDATGRLVSLSPTGAALGAANLPSAPNLGAQLAVNADGSLVAVVAGTGLFVFRAGDLSAVLAEGPCEVEFLWWLPDPTRAVVACGPKASWALELQVGSTQRETAPAKDRIQAALVPRLGRYVQPCEHLPCSAPAP